MKKKKKEMKLVSNGFLRSKSDNKIGMLAKVDNITVLSSFRTKITTQLFGLVLLVWAGINYYLNYFLFDEELIVGIAIVTVSYLLFNSLKIVIISELDERSNAIEKVYVDINSNGILKISNKYIEVLKYNRIIEGLLALSYNGVNLVLSSIQNYIYLEGVNTKLLFKEKGRMHVIKYGEEVFYQYLTYIILNITLYGVNRLFLDAFGYDKVRKLLNLPKELSKEVAEFNKVFAYTSNKSDLALSWDKVYMSKLNTYSKLFNLTSYLFMNELANKVSRNILIARALNFNSGTSQVVLREFKELPTVFNVILKYILVVLNESSNLKKVWNKENSFIRVGLYNLNVMKVLPEYVSAKVAGKLGSRTNETLNVFGGQLDQNVSDDLLSLYLVEDVSKGFGVPYNLNLWALEGNVHLEKDKILTSLLVL